LHRLDSLFDDEEAIDKVESMETQKTWLALAGKAYKDVIWLLRH